MFPPIEAHFSRFSVPGEIEAFALPPNISNMIYLQICEPLYIDRFFRRVRLFQNQQKRQHQQHAAKHGSCIFQPSSCTPLLQNDRFPWLHFRWIGNGLPGSARFSLLILWDTTIFVNQKSVAFTQVLVAFRFFLQIQAKLNLHNTIIKQTAKKSRMKMETDRCKNCAAINKE